MKKGKRHTLLLFRQKYLAHNSLYLLASLVFIGLYLIINLAPAGAGQRLPWAATYDWLLLVVGAIMFLIFLFRVIASQIPYVQCTERNLRIQTPFYPIVISYRRCKETRPNPLYQIFPRDKIKRAEYHLLEKVAGQTAIVVDMDGFPMPLIWMKFWMSNLMFTPDGRGLVLWVKDWMTLNRELSDFKDRWRERKMRRADPTSVAR